MSYVTIYFASTSASSTSRGWSNAAVVAKDTENDGLFTGDNPFTIQSTSDFANNYSSAPNTSDLKRAVDSFYGETNVGSTPMTCYRYVSGGQLYTKQGMIGAIDGSNGTFRTQRAPVLDFQGVWVDFGDGEGQISQTETTHWEAETENSLYTGKIDFTADGPVNDGGTGFDGAPPVGSTVTATYRSSAISEALGALIDEDIQLICLGYDNTTGVLADSGNSLGGVSWLDDMRQGAIHASNAFSNLSPRLFVAALPKGVDPDTDLDQFGSTGSKTFDDIRDQIGANENVAILRHDVVTSGGKTSYDPGAAYMGIIAASHPHRTITLAVPVMGQDSYCDVGEKTAWYSAGVGCIYRRSALSTDPFISYGLTLGSGRAARIDYVRCKHAVAFQLHADLFNLLTRRNIRVNFDGASDVESRIRATLTSLKSNGIIDSIVSVTFPLKAYLAKQYASLTDLEKAVVDSAKNSKRFDGIEVKYEYADAVETIVITAVEVV